LDCQDKSEIHESELPWVERDFDFAASNEDKEEEVPYESEVMEVDSESREEQSLSPHI
jgi:hypothetical protein